MVVFKSPTELVDECGQFAVGAVGDKGAQCLFPVVKFTPTHNIRPVLFVDSLHQTRDFRRVLKHVLKTNRKRWLPPIRFGVSVKDRNEDESEFSKILA